MIEFDVQEYVFAFAQEIGSKARAFVPIPIAAAALGVQPTTVRAYLRNGPLKEVTISSGTERWKGVTLGSLYSELKRRQDKIDEIAEELKPHLYELGPETIEYGEAMALVGLSWRNPHDRDLMGKALGQLSKDSLEHPDMGFMISANVVSKGSGRPNTSFHHYGEILGAVKHSESPEAFWQRQIRKIKKWHKSARSDF